MESIVRTAEASQSVETQAPYYNCASDAAPRPAFSTAGRTAFQKLEDFLYLPRTPAQTLRASVNEAGQATVKTEDGFVVTFLGKNQALSIMAPDGKTTKIWGDPHVTESDGDRWEFKARSTFCFGNNKLTIETCTKPGFELTFCDTVTLYNGRDRFTISDIDIDKPRLVGWKLDGARHDAAQEDGDVYLLESDGLNQHWKKANS